MIHHRWALGGKGLFSFAVLKARQTSMVPHSALQRWTHSDIFDANVFRHILDFVGRSRIIERRHDHFVYAPPKPKRQRGPEPRNVIICALDNDEVYGMIYNQWFSVFRRGDDLSEDQWLEYQFTGSKFEITVDVRSNRMACLNFANQCIVWKVKGGVLHHILRSFHFRIHGLYECKGFFHHPVCGRLFQFSHLHIDSVDWWGGNDQHCTVDRDIIGMCAHPTRPELILFDQSGRVSRRDAHNFRLLEQWNVDTWTQVIRSHLFVDDRRGYLLLRTADYLNVYTLTGGELVCQYRFGANQSESRNRDMAIEVLPTETRVAWIEPASQTVHLFSYE